MSLHKVVCPDSGMLALASPVLRSNVLSDAPGVPPGILMPAPEKSFEHTKRVFDFSSARTPSAEARPFEPDLMNSLAVVSPGFARQIRPLPKLEKKSVPSDVAVMLSGKSVDPGTTTASAARATPPAARAIAQELASARGARTRQNFGKRILIPPLASLLVWNLDVIADCT